VDSEVPGGALVGSLGAGAGFGEGLGGGAFGAGVGDGVVVEPGGHVLVGDAFAGHDLAAFVEDAAEGAGDLEEGAEGVVFVEEAAGGDDEIAGGDGEPVAFVEIGSHILEPQEEAVLDRVHIDLFGEGAAVAGEDGADVVAAGVGGIEAAPAEELGAPGDVGVFAVDEEVGIEELAVDGDVVDHFAGVEGGGGGGAEDVLALEEVAVVDFAGAAVEVAEVGGEVDAGGVDAGLVLDVEVGAHDEEFAADGADAVIQAGGLEESLDEGGHEEDVGVEGEDPVALGEGDGLILCGGEADIGGVVDDLAAVFVAFEDVAGAVGGVVVDDDDLDLRALLGEGGFETAPDVAPAVVGH